MNFTLCGQNLTVNTIPKKLCHVFILSVGNVIHVPTDVVGLGDFSVIGLQTTLLWLILGFSSSMN